MACAAFLTELKIPAQLVAEYASKMAVLNIDVRTFFAFDDAKVEAMAAALLFVKVRPGHIEKIRRGALKRKPPTAEQLSSAMVPSHNQTTPQLKQQRVESPLPRCEWFDDDNETKDRKREAAEYQKSYGECLLLMDPQTIAEIGGVKMHHDIRVARERGDPAPATTVYTFK